MPFSTFTELKTEVIRYLHRGTSLDLRIPDFITLAEHEMYNNPIEPLELKEAEKTSTASTTITSRFLATPSDFASLRGARLDIVDESDFLDYRAPQQMRRYDTSARPCFFTIVGTQIEFDRVPDEVFTVEIQYFSKEPALTSAAPTNDLLTAHPNIYLYGTLAQAFIFIKDNDSASVYKGLFMDAIKGANKADKKARFGPAPVMRVDGSTP